MEYTIFFEMRCRGENKTHNLRVKAENDEEAILKARKKKDELTGMYAFNFRVG